MGVWKTEPQRTSPFMSGVRSFHLRSFLPIFLQPLTGSTRFFRPYLAMVPDRVGRACQRAGKDKAAQRMADAPESIESWDTQVMELSAAPPGVKAHIGLP